MTTIENKLGFFVTKNWQKALIKTLNSKKNFRFIEIELDQKKQVKEFLEWCNKIPRSQRKKLVVMLDNFHPSDIKKFAPMLSAEGLLVEVSGGITEKNIDQYVLDGVSAISSGFITGKADNLDISLNVN